MTSAVSLAETAQRCALIQVIRRSPGLALDELLSFASNGPYASVLSSLCVGELMHAAPPVPPRLAPPLELSVMGIFQAHAGRRLASSFVVERLGIRRWTAQKVLGELVRQGSLSREGSRSTTRYWLPHD